MTTQSTPSIKSPAAFERLISPLPSGCKAPSEVGCTAFMSKDVNHHRINQHLFNPRSVRKMTEHTRKLIAKMRSGEQVFKGKAKKVRQINPQLVNIDFSGFDD